MRRAPLEASIKLAALLVATTCACRKPSSELRDGCLALPPAVRSQLVAGPDEQSLYWIERSRNYDYDADMAPIGRLFRYDARTRATEPVFDNVVGPLQFIGGQLLALRMRGGTAMVVLLGSDGHTQELTPDYLDVVDVEIVDAHTIAFLADGDGARAVYILDLAVLRPYHLVDADVLLSASSGRVFARKDDDILVIDVKTRVQSRIPYIKRSMAQAETLMYVEHGSVMTLDMLTRSIKPSVTTSRDWKLVYQRDNLLARTAPQQGRSYAYVVSGQQAIALPTVVGNASILRTAQLGKNTWALIGHNTSNFIGDLAQTDSEVDVCLLPHASEVKYPTRQAPARFANRFDTLFDTLAKAATDATLGLDDTDDGPTTLSIHLRKEFGARDLDGMRKRTRELHDLVTRQLHDPEIRTDVMFADRRRGVYRWRRDRLRYLTLVGMGDALLSDPTEFDFEVSKRDNERRDNKITCAGTLRNLTGRDLTNVDVKCSGNRAHLIHFDRFAKDESRDFSQTFEVSEDGEAAYLETLVDGNPAEWRSAEGEAAETSVFTLATDVYAKTGMWLLDRQVRGDTLLVELRVEADFMKRDAAAQESAIKTAYEKYTALLEIQDLDKKTRLRIRVDAELVDETIDYDGSRLERN